jgi:hypothetical protein
MLLPFGKIARGVMLAVILLLAISGGVYLFVPRSDPVIEGKRMSAWALDLIGDEYGRSYGIKPEYRRVFKTDRQAAITSLMAVVNYRPSKTRILWFRFTGFLPERMAATLRPKPIPIRNRWAAVLALSNLAREQPDRRIALFFLDCMNHQNTAVRKIAAYEAGPWLYPDDPTIAVHILRIALCDKAAEVRRDACRRIVAFGNSESRYGMALHELLPELREVELPLTPEATKALAILSNTLRHGTEL